MTTESKLKLALWVSALTTAALTVTAFEALLRFLTR